ncbi:MAG: hypothetical protein COW19_05530 [Zetaproteobacteria bacterium CG12_big_fil_rev_8_21_14_0_65_55_1124]|nr:MAG: hypothetical protein AUJ58_07820 [Zetaproteobacteria bacterium CG1_02_55_237]PIS19240.1 MAG: hypothetical protein COT53_06860 [Zetaproteobacteria bacterium CG08_land_8_20_14_0_20_55_17]PIW42899.1 MAG: hypothetical protein COW19_05530 [Zetaproteobacteria bacterium CG12_big_fil_rev_8_21_14_0_65_55_1124]PIY51877.1 MAG: hypothetical protein COZ01_09845 [Zetaproteobacteria bacterium CG_4_10_14_0_8_um_filter_55_43]PIZ39937.1 MAG: hypothetical protein COY36_01500 [Zetaproteobacteria bacterium 
MHILHVITRMDGGGSAMIALRIATEQLKQGHEVCLAFGETTESNMSQAEQQNVNGRLSTFASLGGNIRVLHSLKRNIGIHDVFAYREIGKLIGQGFDLVHTHTSKAGALGRLAFSRKHARAIVHMPHGHIFNDYFGTLATRFFVAMERWLATKADALIAITRAEMEDNLQHGVGTPEQWHVIPSGVDVADIEQFTTAIRAQASHKIVWDAICVGRLVGIKGMDRLLRAWAEVCKHKPDARLVIVGDGEEMHALKALQHDLGMDDNVVFAGWDDPRPYLAASKCFVLLSRNEGMGCSVVEAMAAGLPCVVSNVCGLKELVSEEIGDVVDADSPQCVAQALQKEWPVEMSRACRERAKNFSDVVMVERLGALYEQLTGGDR